MGADVGLRTKQGFVLGTSTKGNKRASKYGGKYEKGAVFKRNGCETVTVNESIPVSKWHKLAQDKENWKDLISEIGEESKKSKAKKKRKWQWNPLASCGAGCAGK